MRVLVMGAGAVGGYFGARLAAAGETVTCVARGAQLEALRAGELRVSSFQGDFTARVAAAGEPSPAELVLFTVKSYDTEAAARRLRPHLGRDSVILCLQNGVENEAVIGASCGAERVVPAVAYVGAYVAEPGHIVHTAAGRIELGEAGSGGSERCRRIAAVFESAGVPAAVVPDVVANKWHKLLYNCAVNPLTTLGGVWSSALMKDEVARGVFRRAVEEAWRVARAEGVAVAGDAVEQVLRLAESMEFRSSMEIDRARGRPLEVEAVSGAVVRLARSHGIQVPVNETLYACLRLLVSATGRTNDADL